MIDAEAAVGSEFFCPTATIIPHDVIAVAGVVVVCIDVGADGSQYRNVFVVIVNDPAPILCDATPVSVPIFITPADQVTLLYADEENTTLVVKSNIDPEPVVSIQFFPSHVFSDAPSLHILWLVGDRGCESEITTCVLFSRSICLRSSMTCACSKDIIPL